MSSLYVLNHLCRFDTNAPVNVNHAPPPPPPDPRDIAGDVTFLQCYISTFTPAFGGIWTVTIPAPRAPVSKVRRALPSRGVWGHAPPPPENFEILYSQRRIFLHSEALLKMVNTTLVESMAICHFIGFL